MVNTDIDDRTRTDHLRCVALTLVIVLAAAGFAAGAVAGADQLAVLTPTPHSVDADPGEEFTVDVTLVTDGGYGGEGVASVDFVAQYNPEYLEVTNVETGPWLEQGEDTEIRSEETIAHENGTAILEQRRDPVAGGATGNDRLATVTVEVAEDAPPGEAEIDFTETSVNLERSYPPQVHGQNVSVAIDGGNESLESFDHPEPDPDELESTQASDDGQNGSGTSENDADDSTPGFGVLAVVATAIAGLVVVFLSTCGRR